MLIEPLAVTGAFLITPERYEDERGFFARTWCEEEFGAAGLESAIVQCSISFNRKKGTLRGMHFQYAPNGEVKLVRCTQGAVYDVIVDIREGSDTYLQHVGFELSATNRQALYIPKGFAHGFLTLTDNAEVYYQMSHHYEPSKAGGFRWDDPAFQIDWPSTVEVINERDANYEDFHHPVAYRESIE